MMHFIHSGRAYRAAQPRFCANGFVNDRVVIQVNLPGGDILYASPALAGGRRGRCRLAAFKAWAAEDVTLHLDGQWEHKTMTHAEIARIYSQVPEEVTLS